MRSGDDLRSFTLALVLLLASCGKKPPPPEDPVEKLGAELVSQDKKKRTVAATALAGHGAAGAGRLARELGNPSKEVRLSAVKGLGKMGEVAIPHLLKALEDEDFSVKEAAAKGLAKHGAKSKDAIPGLIAILAVTEKDLARLEGELRKKSSGQEAFSALLGAAMGLAGAQVAAEDGLEAIGPEAYAPLLEAFNGASPAAKPALASALCRFGEKALPYVEKVARFGTQEARRRLVRSLGHLGKGAIPLVLEMAEDEDMLVSLGATEALRTIGAPAADALRLMLKDPDPKKRVMACERLGWFPQFGDAIRLDLREVAARDGDKEVRKAAQGALEMMESMESLSKDPAFRKDMSDFAKELSEDD